LHRVKAMTRFFLFAMLFSGQVVFGQFADSISKITFRYNKGHYHFGLSGCYSIGEKIEYSKLNNAGFQLTSHIQIKRYYVPTLDSIILDTIKLNLSTIPIPTEKVEKLFEELNISRDNFNAAYVKPFLKHPTKRHIITTAKRYHLKWMFKSDYSDKEDRKRLFKNIKDFSLLDTFLLMKKPNPEFNEILMDAWNDLSIFCLSAADTIQYRSQYFEIFGQPVTKYVNKKYSEGKKTVNLEINNSIREFVPPNSLISRVVDLNQLKKEYIAWFIKTKM